MDRTLYIQFTHEETKVSLYVKGYIFIMFLEIPFFKTEKRRKVYVLF